ncbi:MAG: hypothetical protein AAFU85_11720 [Planctomycetota bacterium]
MKCDHCLGSLVEIPNRSYFRCRDCGTYVFARTLDDAAEPIVPSGELVGVCCPKCECGLQFAELHQRWRVCFCNNCRGFIIENGSLGVLVHELRSEYEGDDATPIPLNQKELTEQRDCPACHHPMDTHPYHGPGTAVINSCRACRVTWMDHGEIASIIAAPGRRHAKGTTPICPIGSAF